MKNFIFICLISFSLFSCRKPEEVNKDEHISEWCGVIDLYPQRYKLISMSGQLSNDILEGNEMPWQEQITFNDDRTFIKVREIDGAKKEASGTFSYELENDSISYFQLNYDGETELAGSCSSKISEDIAIATYREIRNLSWSACDGPVLVYELIENK